MCRHQHWSLATFHILYAGWFCLFPPVRFNDFLGSELCAASFGVHSSNVASILSTWTPKQKVSLLVCKSVITTEHLIWFWNQQSLEICSGVKTREVFKLGKTPKDRQTFLTEKIPCRAKMKKAAREQDAGNLLNSFDSSFNRPWQDFNNLPNKSWPQWGWKIAARAVRRFHFFFFFYTFFTLVTQDRDQNWSMPQLLKLGRLQLPHTHLTRVEKLSHFPKSFSPCLLCLV